MRAGVGRVVSAKTNRPSTRQGESEDMWWMHALAIDHSLVLQCSWSMGGGYDGHEHFMGTSSWAERRMLRRSPAGQCSTYVLRGRRG